MIRSGGHGCYTGLRVALRKAVVFFFFWCVMRDDGSHITCQVMVLLVDETRPRGNPKVVGWIGWIGSGRV